MASYLPVLLYSVGSNAAPDDSALTTLPRGQVDYLSHEWQEEDVWRSWRNMTRQKNEIANGMRLENASWRTWWKQRNKLKTVSPETLNWLKDSDVTWLYGPLHTAVEWTPPPKPKPDETEHKMASARDRLDLSEPKHKSILKYRSISEMLTSDLPSPLFSPAESDNESNGETSDVDTSTLKRPSLSHTKSDTHITRWGPNRNFRKDSPPRIEPSGVMNPAPSTDDASPAPHHVSNTMNLSGYFASHIQGQNQHLSPQAQGEQSTSSSPSSKDGSSETTPSGGIHTNGHRKKHITFNTFVEQCIAIDNPKPKEMNFAVFASEDEGDWYIKSDPARAGYDDGYDEDGEGDWGLDECAIGTDSESDADQEAALLRGEGEIEEDEDEDDEGVIQMRPRRDSFNSKNNAKCLRSTSKVSTSSSSSTSSSNDYSSSSTSAPSSSYSSSSHRKSLPTNIRRRKRSDVPNHISLPRKSSSSTLVRNNSSTTLGPLDKEMVSIAPMPPTILKTSANTSWDGFGVHGVQSPYHPASGAWAESFGDEGFSDDGGNVRAGPGGAHLYFGHHSSDSEGGTPVGLVYMPPATSRYGGSRISRVGSNTSLDSEAEVELREDANQKDADDVLLGDKKVQERAQNGDQVFHHHEAYFSINSDKEGVLGSRSVSVPIVVRTPPAVELAQGDTDDNEGAKEDAYDYFGGPDLGEDFARRKSMSSARRKPPGSNNKGSSRAFIKDEGKPQVVNEERKSRSRSRSRSRTPSPSYVPQSHTPAISVPGRVEQFVSSPPSSSSLLSPPQRGRGAIPSEDSLSSSRGRSSKASSSFSDREHSRSSHSSPIGSLSPEGIGSAYSAHGRGGGDRERERERSNRSGGRGRERTERRLSHSLSPDAVESVTSLGQETASSVSSSISSSHTIIPPSGTSTSDCSSSLVDVPPEDGPTQSHTPANSPVISMSGAAHAIARLNGKSPIHILDPRVSSPSLSYSDPSNVAASSPTSSSNFSDSSTSNDIPANDAGVVGKAVGMVSSAGAYLGLWNNGTIA
jgi:hypothetical protein